MIRLSWISRSSAASSAISSRVGKKIFHKLSIQIDHNKIRKYVCLSLHKDAEIRGTLDMLLCEDFITKHANEQLDLQFVQRVIDSVKADNIE